MSHAFTAALGVLLSFHRDVPLDNLTISDAFLLHLVLGIFLNLTQGLLDETVTEALRLGHLMKL